MSRKIEVLAFLPEENDPGFVAIKIPEEMIPRAHGADALVRLKTLEAFRAFMVAAVEAASMVWPEVAQEWKDAMEEES